MQRFLEFSEEINKKGFSKDLTVYHGTSYSFDDFSEKTVRHKMTPEREVPGYFFTTDANTAYTYASRSARETKGKPRVIAAKLNLENPYDATKDIKKYMKDGMTFSEAKNKAYTSVNREVYDGVYHNGNMYNSPEYVAFYPSQIQVIK